MSSASRRTWARSVRLALGVTIAVVSIATPRLAHAIPFEKMSGPDLAQSNDWEGCSRLLEVMREELGTSRVEVTDEIDYEHLGPADGILMIHPEGSYDVDELATFMKLGGRLAVVDDFGDGTLLLDRFRIERLPAPTDPLQMLHGNPQLPIAVPASGHPIVADVGQVVLNHATVVTHPDLSPLLRIPRAGGDEGPLVAIAGQVGEGRLVAIGDTSVFVNSMMRYPGNRLLARNLADYLLDTSGGHKHDGKLTIVINGFKERGSLGGGVSGSIRDRLRSLSAALDAIRKEGFGAIASRVVALAIATAAAIWVIVRAAMRSKIPRPRYAALDPELATVGRGASDPRLETLVASRRRYALSPTGAGVVHEAIELACAQREDLRGVGRPEAVRRLAIEAKLSEAEVKQAEKAWVRLHAEAGSMRGGYGSAKLSKKDAAILGRVLAPIADSLRAPR